MQHPDTPWSDPSTDPGTSDAETGRSAAVDVCVIGAGIAGLTTAHLLASAGHSVVVFDAAGIGGGETARSSAHLVSALDDRFARLERLHGRHGAQLAAESHMAAIDFIERLVRERCIRCGFTRVDGFLVSAHGDGRGLQAELAAATRAGLPAEAVPAVPGLESWSGPALRFPRQARFDPVAYLDGLAGCCRAAGVRFALHARVVRISDGPEVEVGAADGRLVRCAAAVVATNVPINDRVVLQTKLEAHRSYVLALRLGGPAFPDALVWDDAEPYHYLRLARDAQGELLIVGGEDHKTGQGPADPALPHRKLERWVRDRFPTAGPVVHAWSGQIIEPVDSLAYIGRNPGGTNVHVITGDSGNGLTHGTIGGLLVSDLIRGIHNPWEELYRPARISLRTAGEYAGHNANTLRQYGDWLGSGDAASVHDIRPGEGGIVRQGAHLIAAHRDSRGRLHTCSAVCPHLGGVVRWNQVEGTWDCPCHGSRFSGEGTVLNGPANADLAQAAPDDAVTPFPVQPLVG